MRACGLARLGISLLLFLAMAQVGYGQNNRVYGSRDVISAAGNVQNRPNAYTDPLTDYSRIISPLLGSAWQSVRFPVGQEPLPKSPVYIKFTPPAALLDLLGTTTLSKTNTNLAGNVGTSLSNGTLLGLLGTLTANEPVEFEFFISGDNVEFDGLKLEHGGLGLGKQADYYYLFYIAPPDVPDVTLCEGEGGFVEVSNHKPGYSYRLYDAQTGGYQIGSDITSDTVTIESHWETMDGVEEYWLEAWEDNKYRSARWPIVIRRNKITNNEIQSGDQTICEGGTPQKLIADLNFDVDLLQWQRKTSGDWEDIVGAGGSPFVGTYKDYQPPPLFETTMFRRVATGTQSGVACSSYSNEVTVTVNPLPVLTILSNAAICEGETVAILPYSVTNGGNQYKLTWDDGTPGSFVNVSGWPGPALSGDDINVAIPVSAEPGTYTGKISVRNSATGCEGEEKSFSIQIFPKPGKPHLTISDVIN